MSSYKIQILAGSDSDLMQMQDKNDNTHKKESKHEKMIQKQTRYCPCQAVNQWFNWLIDDDDSVVIVGNDISLDQHKDDWLINWLNDWWW